MPMCFSCRKHQLLSSAEYQLPPISMYPIKNDKIYPLPGPLGYKISNTRVLSSRSFTSVGKMEQISTQSTVKQKAISVWNTGVNCVGNLEDHIFSWICWWKKNSWQWDLLKWVLRDIKSCMLLWRKCFQHGSVVKNTPAMQEAWVQSLGQEDAQEKEMVTLSNILTWEIPGTEEPVRLQSMGLWKS